MKLALALVLALSLSAPSLCADSAPDTRNFLKQTLNPKDPYKDPEMVVPPRKMWIAVVQVLTVVSFIALIFRYQGRDPLHKDGNP